MWPVFLRRKEVRGVDMVEAEAGDSFATFAISTQLRR
jgi:hypothetical protein